MAITNGNYVTSPVQNTTLREKLRDGELYYYEIKAEKGYLLHDRDLDIYDYDDEGNQTGLIETWFTDGGTSVVKNYDFTTLTPGEYKYTDETGIEKTISVTMLGARGFYTVPSSIVPGKRRLGDDYEMEGEMNDN